MPVGVVLPRTPEAAVAAVAQRTGKVVDNVAALEVLLYDGTRFWSGPADDDEYRRIERRGDHRAEIYRRLRRLRDSYADLYQVTQEEEHSTRGRARGRPARGTA